MVRIHNGQVGFDGWLSFGRFDKDLEREQFAPTAKDGAAEDAHVADSFIRRLKSNRIWEDVTLVRSSEGPPVRRIFRIFRFRQDPSGKNSHVKLSGLIYSVGRVEKV